MECAQGKTIVIFSSSSSLSFASNKSQPIKRCSILAWKKERKTSSRLSHALRNNILIFNIDFVLTYILCSMMGSYFSFLELFVHSLLYVREWNEWIAFEYIFCWLIYFLFHACVLCPLFAFGSKVSPGCHVHRLHMQRPKCEWASSRHRTTSGSDEAILKKLIMAIENDCRHGLG